LFECDHLFHVYSIAKRALNERALLNNYDLRFFKSGRPKMAGSKKIASPVPVRGSSVAPRTLGIGLFGTVVVSPKTCGKPGVPPPVPPPPPEELLSQNGKAQPPLTYELN
jgi:hypothetical protein